MTRKDPRRDRPITVEQPWRGLYRLKIDDVLWATVEWSRGRNAWCIEDSCNRCLSHEPDIIGQESSAMRAIATAKWMIRSGDMPGPESWCPFCGRVGRSPKTLTSEPRHGAARRKR